MTQPGLFSPIEDVIREAEERAERDWRIEHDTTALNSPNRRLLCAACGQEDERPF